MEKLEFGNLIKVVIRVSKKGVYFYGKVGGIGKTRLLDIVDSCIDLGYSMYTSTYIHGKRVTNGSINKSNLCIYDRVDLYSKEELEKAIREMELVSEKSIILVDSKNDIFNLFVNDDSIVSNVSIQSSLSKIEVVSNDIIGG